MEPLRSAGIVGTAVWNSKMDELAHLASAGLAIALTAVLMIFSYFYLAGHSARHPLMTASGILALSPSQVSLYQARGF